MDESTCITENSYRIIDFEFDIYFSENAKGLKYRRIVALQEWSYLHPKQRQQLQTESQQFSLGNLILSEEYTQSVLLFEHIKRLTQFKLSVA